MMTDAQLLASDPAASAWVSANAGTGKTKVLCDRVLRILLEGTPPSRILCITYTKAAAAEMHIRIHNELGQWVLMEDEMLRRRLKTLTGVAPGAGLLKRARMLFAGVIDAPGGMRIDTIHAFCQSLLRRFPLEAGIQPHFQVIDETTAAELMAEAAQRLYQHADGDDAKLGHAIAFVAGRMSEGRFSELLSAILQERRILARSLMAGDLESYLAALYRHYGLEPGVIAASVTQEFISAAYDSSTLLSQAAKKLQEGSVTERKLAASIAGWFAQPIASSETAMQYADAYITQSGTIRERLVTKPFQTAHPAESALLELEAERALKFLTRLQTLELVQASEAVARIADALLEYYRHLKQLRSAMDYDDLILTAHTLLQKPEIAPWVLYKLDGGLDHLLVDEAQDTSLEQWEIVEALVEEFFSGSEEETRTRTLFVVGDEKQSIYSFQGAEPRAFEIKRRLFSEKIRHAQKNFHDLKLNVSFRSTHRVLQAVDSVFALPAARQGLTLDEMPITHEVHRFGQAGSVEIWPLIPPAGNTEKTDAWHREGREEAPFRPAQALADRMADTIASWIERRRLLPARQRPVGPGDILILVRKRSALVNYLSRALKRRGVPVAGADRLRIREHIAVMDMMALASFLLLPEDDLTLACLLKSPLFGLSEEQLFLLAHGRKKHSLWERLQGSRDALCIEAADYLRHLLSFTDYVTPYALFARVLEAEGGRRLFVNRLGEDANDPLDEFLSLALDYTCTHSPSLQGFVYWLEHSSMEVKRDMEQEKGEVRIMTVHGAKGLQAPIVILPDTASQIRGRGHPLYWDDTGPEPFLIWPTGRAGSHASVLRLKEARKQKDEEEYRRLLYVALTRAEDELILCGLAPKKESVKHHWHALASEALEPYAALSEVEWFGSSKPFLTARDEEAKFAETASIPVLTPQEKLPSYLLSGAPEEPVIPVPLTPSHLQPAAFDRISPLVRHKSRQRGTHAHRLFQLLPEISPDKQQAAAQSYLQRFAGELASSEREALVNEVLNVLRDRNFRHVFSPDALAEVPIAGLLKSTSTHVLSGQIDRLAITEKEILAVDFKTGQFVPDSAQQVPVAYLRQMAAYGQALAMIYPDKKVSCALLWTAIPLLMPLPDALLAQYPAVT